MAQQLAQAHRVARSGDAIAETERTLCGTAVSTQRAVAEGLALVGRRAASLAWHDERAVDGLRDLPASCVHHRVHDEELQGLPGGFELLAGTPQDAIDHVLVAHRISRALGRPGVCSVPRELMDRLDVVRVPRAEAVARLLVDLETPASSPLELAADAFAAVAGATGRALAPLTASGAETPEVLLIAAGAGVERARELAAALEQGGGRAAVLAVHLVRPFPAEALREQVRGVDRVVVLDGPAGVRTLCEHVTEARCGAEGPLEIVSASAPDAALRRVVGLAEAAAPATGSADRLQALPAGSWGGATVLALARVLALGGDLRVDRADDARATLRLQAAHLAGRDVLLASHPRLADVETLEQVGEGGLVVTLADTDDVVEALSPAQRDSLLRRGIGLASVRHPVDTLRGERATALLAGAALTALDGAEATATASQMLEAEGEGRFAAWLRDGADRVHLVDPAALARDDAPPEQDFRPRPAGFLLPEAPEQADADAAERLASWHLHGPPSALAPGLPRQAAALTALPGAAGPSAWPVAWLGQGRVASLHDLVHEAADGAPRVLSTHLDHLVAACGDVLREQSLGVPLGTVLQRAGELLAERLDLAAEAADELATGVAALGEALPADASLVDLRPETALWLYRAAVVGAWVQRRDAFLDEVRGLREALADRLLLERLGDPEAEESAASLGRGAAGRIDPAAFARVQRHHRGGETLPPERRERIETVLAVLDGWVGGEGLQPVVLAPKGRAIPGAGEVLSHHDPLAAALGVFDGLAARVAERVRAVRTARLEIDDAYDPGRHDRALASLDWEAFTARELGLIPPVLAWTDGARLRDRDQGALTAVVRSSRPIHVLVAEQPAEEPSMPGAFHVDAGSLVLAHREAFAIQSSLARPARLVEALERMAAAPRPGVMLLALPGGDGALMRAEATLWGRAFPEFGWDPDAGESWATRFDLSANPTPEAAWPTVEVPVHRPDGSESALQLAFTWVDAVAHEASWQPHLRPIPPAAWSDEQLPLAGWLQAYDPEAPDRRLPYVWLVDADGTLQRAIATRALALACRDRLRAWRFLQELGGYDNEFVHSAVEEARRRADAEATARIEELEGRHRQALEQARTEATRSSMERLAASLMELDGAPPLEGLSLAAPAAAAPVEAPPEPTVAQAAPAPEVQAPEVEAPEDDEEEELFLGEPYIDTPLCTTCNECTNLNPLLFVYNADQQAEIGDPEGGTFAELVRAAEECPADIIHPGAPRPGDDTATPEMIERASEYN